MAAEEYRVLFLLGLMRSGTTYFRNLLAANRSVQVLGSELSRFWTEVGEAPSGTVPSCQPRAAADLNGETAERVRSHFARWYESRNSLRAVAYRQYRILRYGNESRIKGGRPYYLLNKSTHLHNKIGYLDAIFPDARFVYLVRDVRSQAFSLWQHLDRVERDTGLSASYARGAAGACWGFAPREEPGGGAGSGGGWRFLDVVEYWLDHNLLAASSLAELAPERVTIVSFEDLVKDLDGVLGRLGEFLGLRLTRAVDQRLVNNYTKDPLRSWEQGLTAEQQEILARVLAERAGEIEALRSRLGLAEWRP